MRAAEQPRTLARDPAVQKQQLDRDPKRREVLIAALIAVVLSCAMNFGIVRHLTTQIPGNYDGLLAAWEMSWDGYAITHKPSQLWQANAHYPERDELAFHDSLLGYGIPVGWIGSTPTASIVRFNLLFLFAYAFAFFGAWYLAREMGAGPLPAAIAGAAFAFAPWRLSQPDHLHVLSSGGIPMSIALMLRGYRRGSARGVIGGWVVATWQVSLGFTTGLMLAYLLAGLGVVAATWWAVKRIRIDRRMIVATVIGIAMFGGWSAVQAAPFLRVQKAHPEAAHSYGEVNQFSPPPAGYLTVPPENFVWGKATEDRRAKLNWPSEQEMFPGLLVLTFAVFGFFTPLLRPWVKAMLLAAIAVTVLMSMGPHSPVPGLYKFVYDHAPGWKGVRTPGRLTTITTLALGLAAAIGVHRVSTGLRKRAGTIAASAAAAILVAGILAEGAGTIRRYTPPQRPVAQEHLAGPQLHLPSDSNPDMHYMLWSVGEFPKIVNGHAVFVPKEEEQLRRDVAGFPDAKSVALLRALGVKEVIWHRIFAGGTAWAHTDSKPIDGLGIAKHDHGDVIVFDL